LRQRVGIPTIAASGNDSLTNEAAEPACVPTAIAVGASTKTDLISQFSNMSSIVRLLAPGSGPSSDINSSIPSVAASSYGGLSGTSMATPHVSGAFAAIRSLVPQATIEEIEAALEQTGMKIKDNRPGPGLTGSRIQVNVAAQSLINQLTELRVESNCNVHAGGPVGGPFATTPASFIVSTTGGTLQYGVTITYDTGAPQNWLTASSAGGTVNQAGVLIKITPNNSASLLPAGEYSAKVTFSNLTNNKKTQSRNVTLAVASQSAGTIFRGIGVFPGGKGSGVRGMSADGSIIVGEADFPPCGTGFRWSASTGLIALQQPGWSAGSTEASAISADGSTIVGNWYDLTGPYSQVVRWRQNSPTEILQFPFELSRSVGLAINGDGTTVAGYFDSRGNPTRGFYWVQGAGAVVLPQLGPNNTIATAMTRDGSNVLGDSNRQAFRWTSVTGMQGLGLWPGTDHSRALGVSGDGRVVVGESGFRAARWKAAPEGLTLLEMGSEALASNFDGAVIVGWATGAGIWTRDGKAKLVSDLVTAAGGSTAGWKLDVATAVSDDGRIIAGVGVSPTGRQEGWIVKLPVAPGAEK